MPLLSTANAGLDDRPEQGAPCLRLAAFTRHSPDSQSVGRDFLSRRGALQQNSIIAYPLPGKMVRRSAPLGPVGLYHAPRILYFALVFGALCRIVARCIGLASALVFVTGVTALRLWNNLRTLSPWSVS
jgi:hypothetical protein